MVTEPLKTIDWRANYTTWKLALLDLNPVIFFTGIYKSLGISMIELAIPKNRFKIYSRERIKTSRGLMIIKSFKLIQMRIKD